MQSRNIDGLIQAVYAVAKNDARTSEVAHLANKFSLRNYLRMAEEISQYLPQEAALLDWGCGYGQMTFFLSRLGFRVSSYDIRDVAKNSGFSQELEIKVLAGSDPVRLPYPDKSFDAVLSCGVLEHVADDEKSLQELKRVLGDAGYLFIYMLPNRYSLVELITTLLKKSDHPVKYSFKSIKMILERGGFRIIKTRRGNLIPKNLKLLPAPVKTSIEKLCENYNLFMSLEKVFLNIPVINLFSGTLEIIAKKL